MKFTPTKGTVTVTVNYSPTTINGGSLKDLYSSEGLCSVLHLSDRNESEKYNLVGLIIIGFQDTGVGIDKENQAKLFHEIIQFSPNALQGGGGSGLGLWITKSIVERHHGSVGMHSEGVGFGSMFFFQLPVYSTVKKTTTSSTLADTPISPILMKNLSIDLEIPCEGEKYKRFQELDHVSHLFMGLKILIVDDAMMIRKLMTKLLSSKGSLCYCAEDGLHAVKMVKSNLVGDVNQIFDLILMDFMMPIMNGPQATVEIRSLGFKGLIFGLTGNMMPTDVEYFLRSGASEVLPKPLSVESLENYLASHLPSNLKKSSRDGNCLSYCSSI